MKNSSAFMLLLLSVGLFYTFISPHYDTIKMYRSQSAQYKDILDNVSKLAQKRQDLEAKYANTSSAEVTRLEKVLPDNVDTVNLALNLDAIASKYGISIKSVRATDTRNDGGSTIIQSDTAKPYQPVTITFSFVASYSSFRSFMEDLERSLRIIDVRSVSFTSADNGIYDFQVEVVTYWLN